MTALLRADGLGKAYGGFRALHGMSFEVAEGETLAIIGPNGAGKTTLFKVMTGEVPASSGCLFLGDREITHLPAEQRVRLGLGRTFQIVRVFPEFTLMENLIVAIEARNQSRHIRPPLLRTRPTSPVIGEAYGWLERLGLLRQHAVEARLLSLGDRKRLELALTLALEPAVLVLDEPTAGMSPAERIAIIELIERSKAELGLTILLTEHDMEFVFRLARSILVMNQGEKVMIGTPEQVRASETVQQLYLGKEMAGA